MPKKVVATVFAAALVLAIGGVALAHGRSSTATTHVTSRNAAHTSSVKQSKPLGHADSVQVQHKAVQAQTSQDDDQADTADQADAQDDQGENEDQADQQDQSASEDDQGDQQDQTDTQSTDQGDQNDQGDQQDQTDTQSTDQGDQNDQGDQGGDGGSSD